MIAGYKTTVIIKDRTNETTEKLMSCVRKFGDSELTDRLLEIETGKSEVIFEEMKGNIEGYTNIENGKIMYHLNKKYKQINNEEELWRASIILSHELQRNPMNGDLRGETSEIVLRDMGFIERLANEYGEKVYENNLEFSVLHSIKVICGEEGLREFIDVAFNHEGSYCGPIKEYFDKLIRDSLEMPFAAISYMVDLGQDFIENFFKREKNEQTVIEPEINVFIFNFDKRDIVNYWYWQMIEDFNNGDPWTQEEIFIYQSNEAIYHLNNIINNLPSEMAKMAKQALKDFIILMGEHGSKFALVAYMSGRIDIGIVIDGIAITCEITVLFWEYKRTNDIEKFRSELKNMLLNYLVTRSSEFILGRATGLGVPLWEKASIETFKQVVISIEGISLSELKKFFDRIRNGKN